MAKRNKKREIPPALFCDSSFLIAYFAVEDQNHARAFKIRKKIAENAVLLYTSWPVVSETATLLLYHYGYSHASGFLEVLRAFQLITPHEDEFFEAVRLFHQFNKDQKLSLNDLLSFVLVRNRLKNIPVLSFDGDFIKMGLTIFKP